MGESVQVCQPACTLPAMDTMVLEEEKWQCTGDTNINSIILHSHTLTEPVTFHPTMAVPTAAVATPAPCLPTCHLEEQLQLQAEECPCHLDHHHCHHHQFLHEECP